jgi:hypothetical protein
LPRLWLVSGYALLLLLNAFAVLIAGISPLIFIATATIGLLALLVLWRAVG